MGLAGGLAANGGVSSKFALVDANATSYTVYVDKLAGNDANLGNSIGQAFATLTKAIDTLQQAGHGGEIVVSGVAPGNVTMSAPRSLVQGIFIRSIAPSGVVIERTFATPNSRAVWDAVTTLAGTTANSATASFVAGDVNAIVSIYGAGTGGGTYYDFISSVTDGANVVLSNGSGTAVARNATTDPRGVRMAIIKTGDQGRIVTDASVTAPAAGTKSVITSATANFAVSDIGTEVVLGGAGQGGQALRAAIVSVGTSGGNTTATISATATAAVTNARCAIGVIGFGDLLTIRHQNGLCGTRFLEFTDTSAIASLGAPLSIISDDYGSGFQSSPSDCVFEHPRLTSSNSVGAWEGIISIDGSWNQVASGPGVRRVTFIVPKLFGARNPSTTVPAPTIRIISGVHIYFIGGGEIGPSPLASTAIQSIQVLDPQKNGGSGTLSSADIKFVGMETSETLFYCEGYSVQFFGQMHQTVSGCGLPMIHLSSSSKDCAVFATKDTTNLTALEADERDQGTNNVIETSANKRLNARKFEGQMSTVPFTPKAETFPRQGFTTASQAIGSSGVLVCMGIWLPGGLPLSKVAILGGGTALAWGTGWTGQHFLVGLVDPDGKLFAQTADLGGTATFDNSWQSSHTSYTLTRDVAGVAGSVFYVPRSGACQIVLLINSGTGGSAFTYPTLGGVNGGNAANSTPVLAGTYSSALTSLPTSGVSPAGVANHVYAAVA